MNTITLQNSLALPCGVTLKNRIAKSAMSENMASTNFVSNSKLATLYRRWAHGGAGLLITGNVMIDQRALGEPANVVFESGHLDPFLPEWAKAGKENGTHMWVQLNHPGKQSPKFLSPEPVAPSRIKLGPLFDQLFNEPRELTENEIQDLITRFGNAARIAKHAGFTGVQIHGAHGYLVSQFLSPRHNQRRDQWGGSLPNRMRFVSSVYQSIRNEVGSDFPVGIKLNSADFQRGGFSQEESMDVVQSLSEQGMDLIEVSGGTYEAPEMTGARRTESTSKSTASREAYFLDYCEQLRKRVKTPLMLTGGFRSLEGMNAALQSGACDVIGLARALSLDPEFPNKLLKGGKDKIEVRSEVRPLTSGIKKVDQAVPLEIVWYTGQLHRMGEGKNPDVNLSVWTTILKMVLALGLQGLRRTRAK